MGKLGNEVRPNNGVIITFYVESSALHIHDRVNLMKKNIKRNLRRKNPPTATSSCGYDRRAQLLAHAQELRYSHLPIRKQPEMKQNHKRPEKPGTLARRRVCSPCGSQNDSQRQRRYVRVKKEVDDEKADQPCWPKCFTGRNRGAIDVGESNSSFFKKLWTAMKELVGRCRGSEEVAEKKALSMAAHGSIPISKND